MNIVFVRHGETDWVRERLYQGSTDVLLNRQGAAQAKRTAKLIRSMKPVAVYSSELMRVRQTADPIAKQCHKRTIVDSRLNEISFGIWEGKSFPEIRKQYPEDIYRWYHTAWVSRPSGGESLKSLKKRTSSFLRELVGRYKDRDVTCAVVTHGGPIRMFFLELLQMPVSLFWTIRVDPASVSAVNITSKYTEVTLLNSQAHLGEVRTVFKK